MLDAIDSLRSRQLVAIAFAFFTGVSAVGDRSAARNSVRLIITKGIQSHVP